MIFPEHSYSLKGFKTDLLTALVIAVVLIPQSLAYAFLAGLDPIYGLYGSIIPLIIYPFIGTSMFLSVGPVAIIALLVLSAASGYAEPGTELYLNIVLLLSLLSGLFQLLFASFKLGSLSNFLAKSVLNGFVSAAAIIIIFSQFSNLTSVKVPRSSNFINIFIDAIKTIPIANIYSLSLGIIGIMIIVSFKYWIKNIPGSLVAAVLGILAVILFDLDLKGMPIIGELPSGLPYLKFDFIDPWLIKDLLPSAFVISLICFISSFSIAKSFEEFQDSKVKANRELVALGIAKLVGSFFLTMPSSSSFSRSAINAENKVASGVSHLIVAMIIGLTLLFFGRIFYYLPYPILGSIIISSVFGLIKWEYVKKLWRLDRREFWVCVLTFLFTLIFGIIKGILVGIGLSLFLVIHKMSSPHYAILGRLKGTNSFRNRKRFPEAQKLDGILIIRYDQDLFFGNMDHFYDSMIEELNNEKDITRFILHIGSIQSIDGTSMERLTELIQHCHKRNILFQFTNVSGPIRDLFKLNDIYAIVGSDNFHLNIAHALSLSDNDSKVFDSRLSSRYSSQVNIE